MNAADARDLMESYHVSNILSKIKESAMSGRGYIYIDMEGQYDAKIKAVRYLEGLGYYAEYADQPNTMKISWEDF